MSITKYHISCHCEYLLVIMNHLLGNTADEPNHGRKRPFLTSSTNSLPEFFAIANHQRPTTPPPPSTVEQPETTPTETPPFPFQAPLVSRLTWSQHSSSSFNDEDNGGVRPPWCSFLTSFSMAVMIPVSFLHLQQLLEQRKDMKKRGFSACCLPSQGRLLITTELMAALWICCLLGIF